MPAHWRRRKIQFCRFFVGFRRWEFGEPLMTGSAIFIPEDVRQVCRERVQDQCLWVQGFSTRVSGIRTRTPCVSIWDDIGKQLLAVMLGNHIGQETMCQLVQSHVLAVVFRASLSHHVMLSLLSRLRTGCVRNQAHSDRLQWRR